MRKFLHLLFWGAVKERLQTLADVLEAKVPFPAHPKPVRSFALVSYCCIETQQEHFLLLLPPLHPLFLKLQSNVRGTAC